MEGKPATLDAAHAAANVLFAELLPRLHEIETEEDMRLQVINRVLTEVLGWPFAEVKTEPHSPSGYTDYLLSVGGRSVFIIEAKRAGRLLLATANEQIATYKIGGPALAPAQDGFKQAASYCLDHGVDVATLTNGISWVAFQPFIGDGRSYKDGKGIVFPTWESILSNFAAFYDIFSRAGVLAKLYKVHFAKAEGLSVRDFDPLVAVVRPEDVKMMTRSTLASDLDAVFREFFGTLSGDTDKEMLLECFVETPESRRWDATLEKIIRTISSEVQTVEPETGEQLTKEITSAVATHRGDTIVLVGNKGAGKSTFIERFFELVLEPTIRKGCLVIKVDLLKGNGDLEGLPSWLSSKVREEVERQIFTNGVATFEELQGLYWKDYVKWREGQFKPLYESDKTAFKVRFGEHLNQKINTDEHGYILRLFHDVVANRKLLPCIIFDNADHYPEAFQEAVFQWAQSIRTEIPFSLIFLPVTDRTMWRLSKAGPFQTYRSKLFYLPIPSTKEVLQTRINFLKERPQKNKDAKQYFLGKGIRLSVEDITAFAACAEEIFIKEDFISRRISWLSNHDIRRGLLLSQRVMTSPYLSIDDLVAAYLKRGHHPLPIEYRKFMQALVLGEYNVFQEADSSFVLNVFNISPEFPSTPFLRLGILKFLIDKAGEEGSVASYASYPQITAYFEAMGVSDDATRQALEVLLSFRLVEPYDASVDELSVNQRIAICHSGRMHYEMATTDPIYVSQMAFATPMRSASVVDKIRSVKNARMGTKEWLGVRRDFLIYCFAQDRIFTRVPTDAMYDGQRQLRKDMQGKWIASRHSDEDRLVEDTLPESLNPSQTGRSEVSAKVVWFSTAKGYGFLQGNEGKDIFLPRRAFGEIAIDGIAAGDTVVCDVGPGEKGRFQATHVSKLEKAVPQEISLDFKDGVVDFYNVPRGFGFVEVAGLTSGVYISARVLEKAGIRKLMSGELVKVAIENLSGSKGPMAVQIRKSS